MFMRTSHDTTVTAGRGQQPDKGEKNRKDSFWRFSGRPRCGESRGICVTSVTDREGAGDVASSLWSACVILGALASWCRGRIAPHGLALHRRRDGRDAPDADDVLLEAPPHG